MDIFATLAPVVGWATLPIFMIILAFVVWRGLKNSPKSGYSAFIARFVMCLGLIAASIFLIFGEIWLAAFAFVVLVLLVVYRRKPAAGMDIEGAKGKPRPKA